MFFFFKIHLKFEISTLLTWKITYVGIVGFPWVVADVGQCHMTLRVETNLKDAQVQERIG